MCRKLFFVVYPVVFIKNGFMQVHALHQFLFCAMVTNHGLLSLCDDIRTNSDLSFTSQKYITMQDSGE